MNCPICQNNNLEFIYKFTDGPAMQNKLYDSLKSALREEKVSINLYGCKDCGFVFNANFNPKKVKYSSKYDNSQDNSPYFFQYITGIVKKLNKKYNLKEKNVAEIGCGKGRFLELLYDQGVKKIKGFDPSYVNHNPQIDKLVIKKFFNVKNVKKKFDFIICRHVLEHVPNPREFISSITNCLTNNGIMYFEFPSLEWIVKNKTFFDFFYEHCNYFTKSSVTALFSQFGFKNVIFNYGLGGQYFQLEISRSSQRKNKKNQSFQSINFNQIPQFITEKINTYQKMIDRLDNFTIWGAGAKGVTFLNRLDINRHKCKYVIDINPNKQNKFVPITGQKVVSPKILEKEKINKIIIVNPMYEREIKAMALNYNYQGEFIIL